jgi:hypothetical protein
VSRAEPVTSLDDELAGAGELRLAMSVSDRSIVMLRVRGGRWWSADEVHHRPCVSLNSTGAPNVNDMRRQCGQDLTS